MCINTNETFSVPSNYVLKKTDNRVFHDPSATQEW